METLTIGGFGCLSQQYKLSLQTELCSWLWIYFNDFGGTKVSSRADWPRPFWLLKGNMQDNQPWLLAFIWRNWRSLPPGNWTDLRLSYLVWHTLVVPWISLAPSWGSSWTWGSGCQGLNWFPFHCQWWIRWHEKPLGLARCSTTLPVPSANQLVSIKIAVPYVFRNLSTLIYQQVSVRL